MIRLLLCLAISLPSCHAMNWYQQRNEPKFKKIPAIEAPQIPLPCINIDEQIKQNMFYCPHPSQLYLENNKWKTKYGWKSYEVSFTKKISRFVGAQWQGVNIGRITCLYQSINANDFPVQLSTDSLIQIPTKPLWHKLPSGVVNCVSTNNSVCDCPFSYVKSKNKQSVNEVIKSLE